VKHFVAQVVKTFGWEHVIADSLDDFRYEKHQKHAFNGIAL
jgi:hypothetical protein